MLEYTQTEWIKLSEIFRGSEEICFQIMRDFPDDPIFSLDWVLLYQEKRITKVQLKRYQTMDESEIDGWEKECWRKEIQIITPNSKEYPSRLMQYYNPPLVLYAVGDLSLLNEENALSVVGTRSASEYGSKSAYRLSADVAAKGIVIVSGCAVGIDAAAHNGALSVEGKTIAVLGCGLDVNYPAENFSLRKNITAKGGLQISEYPPGVRPRGGFFPHRNRIISGLSRAVLVAEAPYKSGALITAEYAVEQGKELFCVPPYSIWDPKCGGVAGYLRDGAIPVFSAADILIHYFTMEPSLFDAELFLKKKGADASDAVKQEEKTAASEKEATSQAASEKTKVIKEKPQFEDPLYQSVYDQLAQKPMTVDILLLKVGGTIPELLNILCELELRGIVENSKGDQYQLKE